METEDPAIEAEGFLPPEPPPVPRKTWVDRVQALFEVILLSGAVSGILASIPFVFHKSGRENLLTDLRWLLLYVVIESVTTLALLWLVLRAHRDKLGMLGFLWQRWRRDAVIGLALVPFLFGLNIVITVIFQKYFPEHYLDHNPLTDLIKTPWDLAMFILVAWFAGGIKEELQRAFILKRFQAYLGGAWLGLIVWSVSFGFGHYVQGAQGVLAAGLYGLVFGITYLVRGSLIAPIVAHGVYDTVALLSHWFLTRTT